MKLYRKWNFTWRSSRLFLLPSMAGILVFAILPFGYVLVRSFSGGIEFYRTVLRNEAFHLAVVNTCRFAAVGIPLLLLLSFAAALGIYKSKWVRFFKSVYLLPMAVPTAVVVLIWNVFFHKSGIANQLTAVFGIEAVDWMSSNASFWVLVISYIWKNLGYTIILWIAGMAAIPKSVTEAAK